MKGMVFTEFLEMVEDKFSPEVADDIIESCELPSGGAYTAVGTYDASEMVQLVGQLSERTGIAVAQLLKTFGVHLFHQFAKNYQVFFASVDSAFTFLGSIEDTIHVEVRKLYPDADLPSFEYEYPDASTQRLIYRSSRPFTDLAEGLIHGTIEHFGEDIAVARRDHPVDSGAHAEFTLTKRA